MHPFSDLLVLFGILCVFALVILLRWERRDFVRMEKGGAWLAVRIWTIPIALVTAAIIILPARSTSGMEGLAVFYVLLFTAAPLFWFGAHWIVGRIVQPKLSFSESVRIAGSPILLLIAMSAVAQMLQPLAWSVLRTLGKA
ncbi:MAG: hypothetical protein M3O62_01880 [Pseudomonadota bacterium]|nr:hypothetical protein [Pseudomonadota bacterium]